MPTPVSTARQCLTDEAARALDAAVAIARRRSHTQTTSLHALSALLSLPSSPLLRDACSRSHCTPYSPRLQFRALDLCVGVSLDRLPTSKSTHHPDHDQHHNSTTTSSSSPTSPPSSSSSGTPTPPPISNSLMAAIKRSQANQRRQPEMYQITYSPHHSNPNPIASISAIKVELKNFVVSILDDPIVSRVLGEAGFRSHDIKLAILHPPVPPPASPAARFLRAAAAASRFPPPPLLSVPFPFSTTSTTPTVDDSGCSSYYSRRISEILMKKSGSGGRNPLLVGVCAKDALTSFRECVEQRKSGLLLPSDVSFVCLEKEIQGFVTTGSGGREKLESKIDELESVLEKQAGPGLVVSYGDLKVLLGEDDNSSSSTTSTSIPSDGTKFVVEKLSGLVGRFKEKMWLIGWVATSDTCKKLLNMFPSLESDWDLQSLPVTSSRSTVGGLYSKSSFMGSFVPFAGFFSELGNHHQQQQPVGVINHPPSTTTTSSSIRCPLCNEKYNQELSAVMKAGSSSSTFSSVSATTERCSPTLPSWLQTKQSTTTTTSKPQDTTETNTGDDPAKSNATALRLQEKWNEICQRLGHHHHHHHPHPPTTLNNPTEVVSVTRSQVPCSVGFLNAAACAAAANNPRKSISECHPHPCDRLSSSSLDSSTQIMIHKTTSSATQPPVSAEQPVSATSRRSFSREGETITTAATTVHLPTAYHSPPNQNLPGERKSPSSVTSVVTTDLGLGSLQASAATIPCQETSHHIGRGVLEHFSSTSPSTTHVQQDVASKKSAIGSSCNTYNGSSMDYNYPVVEDPEDYKQILKKLIDRVPWQVEACQNISRMLSSFCSRKGNGQGQEQRLPPFDHHHHQQHQQQPRGLWMVLDGPDKMGKKKVGAAIADAVFGSSRDSLIVVDLSSQEDRVSRESNSIFGKVLSLLSNDVGVRSGRKTVVDHLADELRRKPHSVVVLENADESDDLVVQRSLSRAIQTGRLPDSHGREISISNAIFVTTTSSSNCSSSRRSTNRDDEERRFTEERILNARIWQMKIAVEQQREKSCNNRNNDSKRPRVVLVATDDSSKNRACHHHVSKRRRLLSHSDHHVSSMTVQKKPRRCLLDLNLALPVEEEEEEEEEVDESCTEPEDSSFLDPSSRAWWAEFQHQVEGKVVEFKTVDFDLMAEKLMSMISARLERVLGRGGGVGVGLEIDEEAMVMMLGAAWSSEKEGAVEGWTEEVLGGAFMEARSRHCNNRPEEGRLILKLVVCPGNPVDKRGPGICLPGSVHLLG